MKVIKSGLFLAGLAGVGFAGYKMAEKAKIYKEDYDVPVVFGGKEEKITNDFGSSSYGVLCGGLSLDLSEAIMVENEATLTIDGEFCGISIKVPKDWNVKVDGIADKSGVSIECDFDEADIIKKRLYIKYDIKFGGMEVKFDKEVEEEDVIDVDLAETFEESEPIL